MAKTQNQNNAAGMPILFRLAIAVAVAYGASWAFDNVLQPQNAHAPAYIGAQETLRNAVQAADAHIWK